MDDNVWEYPFGDLDDDEDLFFRKPQPPVNSAGDDPLFAFGFPW